MALTFDFEFFYRNDPEISIRIASLESDATRLIRAFIDTGAQKTILDDLVAEQIGLDLESAERITLFGVGGRLEGFLAEVELALLGEPELTYRLPVAFAPLASTRLGNLVGLDVLSHVGFGLDHGRRLGYLGRVVPDGP